MPSQANVIVGPGGPLITVSSVRGSAFLYDGGMEAHRPLAIEWRPIAGLLTNRRRASYPPRFPPPDHAILRTMSGSIDSIDA